MDILKQTDTGRWPSWWPKRFRHARMLWVTIAVVVLFLVVGAFGLGKAMPTAERSELWIDTAVKGEMKREIRASGVLVPKDTRWVVAGAAASVQQVVVEPGAKVNADTVILVLVNPELQANLEKTKAALAGAEAEVVAKRTSLQSQVLDQQAAHGKAESEWKVAEMQAQAYKRAYEGGAISANEMKKSQIEESEGRKRTLLESQRVVAARQNMDAQLRATMAHRDEAASALDVVRQQVESLQVRAGIGGILQQVDVEAGQQVELGTKLARVARPEALMARLQVSETLAKDLALDLKATVDTRTGIAQGTVVRVDPAVRNGTVTVDISFTGELPTGVRPDLTVDGRIQLGALHDVVSIGRPSLATPGSEASLFIIRSGEDVAHRVPVRYGAVSSDRIEVRAGVNPGDQVILSDTSRWDDIDTLHLR